MACTKTMSDKEIVKVITAHDNGEVIEFRHHNASNTDFWMVTKYPCWAFNRVDYRIQPKKEENMHKDGTRPIMDYEEMHDILAKAEIGADIQQRPRPECYDTWSCKPSDEWDFGRYQYRATPTPMTLQAFVVVNHAGKQLWNGTRHTDASAISNQLPEHTHVVELTGDFMPPGYIREQLVPVQ
eukprot:GHVR01122740.1.p1 GENE.GHVR01122740.1~~GHVR01122740.1.p1  ORF type:complete len:183 (-),score=30.23 GHVR01122740.1:59-607(-)